MISLFQKSSQGVCSTEIIEPGVIRHVEGTRFTLGELPEMRDLLRAIFTECASVADRLGISFPVSLDRRLEAGLAVTERANATG